MGDIPDRLGRALRSCRLACGWSQATVAERSGLSTSSYSRMELGDGGPVTLDRWIAATRALDQNLVVDLLPTPSDDSEVRLLRLVEGLAERGGWSTHTTDSLDGPLHVRIARPARREAAVVSIWDAVTDVGRAVDDFHHAVAGEATRRPPDWRIGGLVVAPESSEPAPAQPDTSAPRWHVP